MTKGGRAHGNLLSEAGLFAGLWQVAVLCRECPEDLGLGLERQCLRAHRRLDARLLQRSSQRSFGVFSLQIVPQRLALLSERELQELDERLLRNMQRFQLR